MIEHVNNFEVILGKGYVYDTLSVIHTKHNIANECFAHTTTLRAPLHVHVDIVLALEVNVGLGFNNEDATRLFELAEAGEIELKSNPISFQEVKVASTTFLGENVE